MAAKSKARISTFSAAGSKVMYSAGYKALDDRYRVDDIEASSDVVMVKRKV